MDTAQIRAKLETYADRRTQEDTVAWLDGLVEDKFRKEVTDNLGNRRDSVVSQALRDPRNVAHWEATLSALIVETHGQIAAVAGDQTPETRAWRSRANVFLSRVVAARKEARALRLRYNLARYHSDETGTNDTKQLRRGVGDNALRRLAEAHPREFDQLLMEEYRNAGLEPPAPLLNRIAVYGRVPLRPEGPK